MENGINLFLGIICFFDLQLIYLFCSLKESKFLLETEFRSFKFIFLYILTENNS